jgi:hypothetical protein
MKKIVKLLIGLGLVGFISSLVFLLKNGGSPSFKAMALFGFSALIIIGGTWFFMMIERRGWKIVDARCFEKNLKQIMSPNGDMSGWVLVWRIRCKYEYLGKLYEVAPKVGWCETAFASEKKALKFLKKRISSSHECKLRINPKDPHQAELINPGIASRLFLE